jgi:hypothetical protein
MIGFLKRLAVGAALLGLTLARDLASAAVAVAGSWRSFWLDPADPRPLGVVRAGAGLALLCTLASAWPSLEALQGPEGWLDQQAANQVRLEAPTSALPWGWEPLPPEPAEMSPEAQAYAARWGIHPGAAARRGLARFSPYFHLREPWALHLVHAAAVLAATALFLGLGGRGTCLLAWAACLSSVHRAQPAILGSDVLLPPLLLYLTFGPATAWLSLDRWLGWSGPLEKSEGARVSLRLIQVHGALLMLASGLGHWRGLDWWGLSATWNILASPEAAPLSSPYWSVLAWTAGDRLTWSLTHGVIGCLSLLLLQVSVPLLAWQPGWRPACVAITALLAVALAAALGDATLGMLTLVYAASFLSPEALGGKE